VTTVRWLAVVITGLALIAPGAQLFELYRKIAKKRADLGIAPIDIGAT